MSNNVAIKISQLNRLTGSSITSDDYLPIVDSGSGRTYRVTLGDIASFSNQGITDILSSDDKQILFNHGGVIDGVDTLRFNYISSSFENGISVTASAFGSHAEGYLTFTDSGAFYAHAEGVFTTASSYASHAEGVGSVAFGTGSHASGYYSVTYGDYSYANGNQNITYAPYQTVIGQYNQTSINNSDLFLIGNGTGPSIFNRSNIVVVNTSSVNIYGNLIANAITSSLFGTASYALNVLNGGGGGGGGQWSTSGNNIYYNTGYVGIGTTNPLQPLEVDGNILITGQLVSYNGAPAYSNMVGSATGYGATYATDSNFFGRLAGNSSTNASGSIFIGVSSGQNSNNAAYSIFLGQSSGKGATNAAYSIFLGYFAGNSDTVNNTSDNSSILIGNYTSTGGYPDSIAIGKGTKNSATQQLNIGNVLYATGIYNNSTPSSTPTGGRVGIGTDSPQSTLHVVGNISASSVTSSLFGTASYAISASESQTGYNGNRSIKRSGYSGINVGGTNLKQFIENFFFPFLSATVSLTNTGTYYYETGSIRTITTPALITPNEETVFGTSYIQRDSSTVYTTVSPSPLNFGYSDVNVSSSHTYQAFTNVNNNGSPTTVSSGTQNVNFIFPYLYGTSATAGLSGTSLYTTLVSGKDASPQGSKIYNYNNNSIYMYFCYPSSYPDLSSIIDPNNFQVISTFQYSASVSVTSSGLTNNWMRTYKVYRTVLPVSPNGNFTFS